jgi:hypothetical protein
MLRLTRAPNIAIAALWVDLLQQAGIAASVQRYFLGSVAGELPPDQCQPEVWLTHHEEEPRARALLDHLQNMPQRRWLCACGETVEGGFEQCWNCLRPAPTVVHCV